MRPLFSIKRKSKILLFDWSNTVAKAYAVERQDGMHLLCGMLKKYRRRFPSYVFVFAIEGRGREQRQRIYAGYKADREASGPTGKHPETLDMLDFLHGKVIRAPKGEADDAIAAYIRQQCEDAGKVLIVSEDRDLWQLIKRKVHVLTRKGEISEVECQQLLGVAPAHVRMLKSLTGDNSDNLPRVPRAKTKTLKRLAYECATLRELHATIDDAEWIKVSERELLKRFRSQVERNYNVIGLRSKLALDIQDNPGDASGLIEFLQSRGVKLNPMDAAKIAT